MDALEIAHRRLHGHRLTGPLPDDPVDVVRWLAAMQAQDYAVGKWSVAQRTASPDDAILQRAIDEGRILRTHALRPTWHFVAAEDIAWVQALTASRVHALNAQYYRMHGLDEEHAAKTTKAITGLLRGGNYLTRKELAEALATVGLEATGNRLAYVVMRAELDGLIANGPMRGKQHTYALISERAPGALRPGPDEALAELTRRYFTSHGPATVKDFSWWSSLTASKIKRGLQLVGDELSSEVVDGRTYWFAPPPPPPGDPSPRAHVLQGLDEYTVAYSESRDVVNIAGWSYAILHENMVVHSIVLDSQVVGVWRRVVNRRDIRAEVSLATKVTRAQRVAIEAAFARYGAFAGVPVGIDWAPAPDDGSAAAHRRESPRTERGRSDAKVGGGRG